MYLCRFRCTDTGCLAVEVTVVSSDEVYCLLCSCSGQSNIAQRNSASAQQFEIFAKLLTFDVHMFISLYAILFVSGNLPTCCAVYVAKCLCEAPTALIRLFFFVMKRELQVRCLLDLCKVRGWHSLASSMPCPYRSDKALVARETLESNMFHVAGSR